MHKTYVLVHGLFHGGLVLEKSSEAAGHQVYSPTQTGLGERSHLLSTDIGISVFVEDLVNVIKYEELSDIILLGHSFGGMAITGAADVMPERIRHIVYLDAIVPQNGQNAFSQFPDSVVRKRQTIMTYDDY